MKKEPTIARYEEACVFVKSVKDKTANNLLKSAIVAAMNHFSKTDKLPDSDFDMLFMVEALEPLFRNHNFIKKALAGEQLDMFDDSD